MQSFAAFSFACGFGSFDSLREVNNLKIVRKNRVFHFADSISRFARIDRRLAHFVSVYAAIHSQVG
jgi:hypothetical protein